MSFISAEIISISPSDSLQSCSAFGFECGNYTNGRCNNNDCSNNSTLIYNCGNCVGGDLCVLHKCKNSVEICKNSYICGGEFCVKCNDQFCFGQVECSGYNYNASLICGNLGIKCYSDVTAFYFKEGQFAYLDKEYLKKNDTNLSLTIIQKNSLLPKGTKVYFEIYKIDDPDFSSHILWSNPVGIKIGNNAIEGIVDETGDVSALWKISMEDLAKANYDGRTRFMFDNSKDNQPDSFNVSTGTDKTISSSEIQSSIIIITKENGKCSGNIPCSNFSEWECEELKEEVSDSNCVWSEETNSCEGSPISCNLLQSEDSCNSRKDFCSWKFDNWWEGLTNWFSNLFNKK